MANLRRRRSRHCEERSDQLCSSSRRLRATTTAATSRDTRKSSDDPALGGDRANSAGAGPPQRCSTAPENPGFTSPRAVLAHACAHSPCVCRVSAQRRIWLSATERRARVAPGRGPEGRLCVCNGPSWRGSSSGIFYSQPYDMRRIVRPRSRQSFARRTSRGETGSGNGRSSRTRVPREDQIVSHFHVRLPAQPLRGHHVGVIPPRLGVLDAQQKRLVQHRRYRRH